MVGRREKFKQGDSKRKSGRDSPTGRSAAHTSERARFEECAPLVSKAIIAKSTMDIAYLRDP